MSFFCQSLCDVHPSLLIFPDGLSSLPALSAASNGKRFPLSPPATDDQLLSRLGGILGGNMREDFIVVHMQEVCTFCRKHFPGNVYMYK